MQLPMQVFALHFPSPPLGQAAGSKLMGAQLGWPDKQAADQSQHWPLEARASPLALHLNNPRRYL